MSVLKRTAAQLSIVDRLAQLSRTRAPKHEITLISYEGLERHGRYLCAGDGLDVRHTMRGRTPQRRYAVGPRGGRSHFCCRAGGAATGGLPHGSAGGDLVCLLGGVFALTCVVVCGHVFGPV